MTLRVRWFLLLLVVALLRPLWSSILPPNLLPEWLLTGPLPWPRP